MRTPVRRFEPVAHEAPAVRWLWLRGAAPWTPRFETGAASLRGSAHLENEDSALAVLPAPALLAVADGVGGGAQGKVASGALVERLRLLRPGLLSDRQALREWLLAADDAVAGEVARYSDQAGASTFVAAVPARRGRRWLLTWTGDCRAYCASARRLAQLTQDETYDNLGEAPPAGAQADDPARMVGSGAVDQPQVAAYSLADSEVLMLCSDGVHKWVPPQQMLSLLRGGGSLQQRCMALVAAAHANGGTDDATVVAIQRHGHALSRRERGLLVLALLAGAAAGAWLWWPR